MKTEDVGCFYLKAINFFLYLISLPTCITVSLQKVVSFLRKRNLLFAIHWFSRILRVSLENSFVQKFIVWSYMYIQNKLFWQLLPVIIASNVEIPLTRHKAIKHQKTHAFVELYERCCISNPIAKFVSDLVFIETYSFHCKLKDQKLLLISAVLVVKPFQAKVANMAFICWK